MATTKKAVKKAAPKKATRAPKPTTGFNDAQAMDVLWLVLLFTVLSVIFAAMSYWRYRA